MNDPQGPPTFTVGEAFTTSSGDVRCEITSVKYRKARANKQKVWFGLVATNLSNEPLQWCLITKTIDVDGRDWGPCTPYGSNESRFKMPVKSRAVCTVPAGTQLASVQVDGPNSYGTSSAIVTL